MSASNGLGGPSKMEPVFRLFVDEVGHAKHEVDRSSVPQPHRGDVIPLDNRRCVRTRWGYTPRSTKSKTGGPSLWDELYYFSGNGKHRNETVLAVKEIEIK